MSIKLKTAKTINEIVDELEFARSKFPNNDYQLTALNEEVGELNKAMLEFEYGNETLEGVYKEAIQVAAMAIRVATEGDSTFNYVMPEK